MRTRAAVAYEVGKPLVLEEVELDGPRAGEVLVEIKATGVCHTDEFTRSGADPEGLFPVIFGHEGAGVVVDIGPGVTTLANVLPEIALAKVRSDAPFDKICYIGCGVTTGIGAVIYTAKVEPGANVVVFGLGGIGLNVVQGARIAGADKIIGVDLNPTREALARKLGLTHFVNPNEVGPEPGSLVSHLIELTSGGADYSFECVGNVELMALRRRNDLSEIASVVSRDLRAPLRGITHLAQWAEEALGDGVSPDVKRHLALLRDRAQKMETMLDALLRYARLAEEPPELVRVDTGLLVAAVSQRIERPSGITIAVGEEMRSCTRRGHTSGRCSPSCSRTRSATTARRPAASRWVSATLGPGGSSASSTTGRASRSPRRSASSACSRRAASARAATAWASASRW